MKGAKKCPKCGKSPCMCKGKPKMYAEGGKVERERVKRVSLADPRTTGEKVAGMINRVASGNRNAPVRTWDDPKGTQGRRR